MRLLGLKLFICFILLHLASLGSAQAAGFLGTCKTLLKASLSASSKSRAAYLKESKAIVLDEPLVRYISVNSINLEAVSHDHLLALIRDFRGSPVERFLRTRSKVVFQFDTTAHDTTIEHSSMGFRLIRIPADHKMAEHFLYAVGYMFFEDFVSHQQQLMTQFDNVAFKSKKFSGDPQSIYALGFSIYHGAPGLLKSLDSDFQKFMTVSIDAYGPRTLDSFSKKKSRP